MPAALRETLTLGAVVLVAAALWFVPSPPNLAFDSGAELVRAQVVSVDDSGVETSGLLRYGTQRVVAEALDGKWRGKTFSAANELRAQLELDKEFAPGDVALLSVKPGDEPGKTTVVAKDHWRLGWAAALFGGFCVLLCAFGGWTGAKALFSFVFSCVVVWKGVVPFVLAGWPAAWVSFAAVSLLTGAIMALVAGFTRKGTAAFLGAMLGVGTSFVLAHLFGGLMHVDGATMPFVQALLYSGCEKLDFSDVFVGAAILASSGAVMDLAMDVASGIEEVARHNPSLPKRELFLSGVRIGRSVVGTMTTTLLLAYSGGFLTLLMAFAAQATAPTDFLNSTLVSAEIVKTLVGSFGLVLVAPFTALAGAFAFASRVPPKAA